MTGTNIMDYNLDEEDSTEKPDRDIYRVPFNELTEKEIRAGCQRTATLIIFIVISVSVTLNVLSLVYYLQPGRFENATGSKPAYDIERAISLDTSDGKYFDLYSVYGRTEWVRQYYDAYKEATLVMRTSVGLICLTKAASKVALEARMRVAKQQYNCQVEIDENSLSLMTTVAKKEEEETERAELFNDVVRAFKP